MNKNNLRATYWIETGTDPEKAAAVMAGEQSSGTFVKVEAESEELVRAHGAEVVSVRPTGEQRQPSLPGAAPAKDGLYRQAIVEIDFPVANIGHSLPALQTMLAGNLFELHPFSGLRLLDFHLPPEFIDACPGPRFGINGTRHLAGVEKGPLLGTIIKPSVGLSMEETARLCGRCAAVGLDFIKDDELMGNAPYSTVQDRIGRVLPAIAGNDRRASGRTLYAVNISDLPDEMKRHHDVVKAAGGNCVMVNLISVGLAGILALRQHSELPIHGHRNGWGALSRCPALGFSYPALQKFWKLAGVDHLHVNGLRNKFCEDDESVLASARAVQQPQGGCRGAMPVFSSGQWVDQVEDTYLRMGNADLLYVCGGGIWAHPGGPEAGVTALRAAWKGVMQGQSLADLRTSVAEIDDAYATFTGKS